MDDQAKRPADMTREELLLTYFAAMEKVIRTSPTEAKPIVKWMLLELLDIPFEALQNLAVLAINAFKEKANGKPLDVFSLEEVLEMSPVMLPAMWEVRERFRQEGDVTATDEYAEMMDKFGKLGSGGNV